MNPQALKVLITARKRAAVQREKKQIQLLDNTDGFAEQIEQKLAGLCDTTQFWNFSRCGKEEIYRTCGNCGSVDTFYYRCNLKWCPRCQQRLGNIRRNLIGVWAKRISQPKHLVLTMRNFRTLTRKKIREMTRALARLRRAKCFAKVRGGCVSLEITNEGNGWHLHAHLLLDVDWLEMPVLAKTWAREVGQQFAIVKIKDVRANDYLNEICKYVVEGSELAKWKPDEINEFVHAVKGVRMFNSFGKLRELAPQIRLELAASKPPGPVCKCGCAEFTYQDEVSVSLEDARRMSKQSTRYLKERANAAAAAVAAAAAGSKFQQLGNNL